MGLQSLVEVVCADARNDNGHEKQDNRQNGKRGQRLAGGLVVFLSVQVRNVHADELEQEIGERDEVDNDATDHACNGLATDPESRREEQEERDDECGGGENFFHRGCLLNHDQELDCERKEEEEVELEQGNVNLARVSRNHVVGFHSESSYLVRQITPLQSQVGADVLVDSPCEFII